MMGFEFDNSRLKTKIKILMVLDGDLTFSRNFFGLNTIIETYQNIPEWWYEIEVTMAHRGKDEIDKIAKFLNSPPFLPEEQTFRDNYNFLVEELTNLQPINKFQPLPRWWYVAELLMVDLFPRGERFNLKHLFAKEEKKFNTLIHKNIIQDKSIFQMIKSGNAYESSSDSDFENNVFNSEKDPNRERLKRSLFNAIFKKRWKILERFRFEKLDHFHEIFLFGYLRSSGDFENTALGTSEILSINNWMDKGGGIFGCGDHGSFGGILCGEIPRVRKMQKWHASDQNKPFNWNNTLQSGRDNPLTPWLNEAFSAIKTDQSDDIPMPITPLEFHNYHENDTCSDHSDSLPFLAVHPILSDKEPKQAIDILPDHLHEGEVIDPTNYKEVNAHRKALKQISEKRKRMSQPRDKNLKELFKAYSTNNEFEWNVVAYSTAKKSNGLLKQFPVLGAYNGHVAKTPVGRIVVDASFHHWLDVNLSGLLSPKSYLPPLFPGDLRKLRGFLTDSGEGYFQAISKYHRNVVTWLAPQKIQHRISKSAFLGCFNIPEIQESLNISLTTTITSEQEREIGKNIINLLGKYVGEVEIRGWWPAIDRYHGLGFLNIFKKCQSLLPVLDEFVIGSIIVGLAIDFADGNEITDRSFVEAIEIGVGKFKKYLAELSEQTMSILESSELISRFPEAQMRPRRTSP